MRARVSIYSSGVSVELREVVLKDKPQALREASPKATVPTLVLGDGRVVDESLDIVHWALAQNDPQGWLPQDGGEREVIERLIDANDGWFKQALDRYKYPDRFPEASGVPVEHHRSRGEAFLQQLEDQLLNAGNHGFLLGSRQTLADVAIFPFIRQFAHVDKQWFFSAPYPRVQHWLEWHLAWPGFSNVMRKYPQWQPGAAPVLFGSSPI